MLAVGVLIMVVIDLIVLVVFTAVVGGLNLPLIEVVPHKEDLQTVEGVSIILYIYMYCSPTKMGTHSAISQF